MKQLREVLAACNQELRHEALAVNLLVGAGLRRADRGIAELRVRGDGGAKVGSILNLAPLEGVSILKLAPP